MSVPEHLWRFPTREAIDSLAVRFGFANSPQMQDWEWEVADAGRLDEFLAAYTSGELGEDERFTLMETILQSFEESELDLSLDARWNEVLNLLEAHIDLHAYSVWYWSCLESDDSQNWFRSTPYVRQILARHRLRLEVPSNTSLERTRDR